MHRSFKMFYGMLKDPAFSFGFFNRDKTMSMKKQGKKWEIMNAQLDYMMSVLLSSLIVIACGRSCGKTSSVEHMIFSIAMLNPKKWTGYIVKNMRHCNVLVQALTEYFNKDEFTREFFVNFDKKDRIFTFRNGHKVEIRIVGHDKTGSTTLVSGHYNFLFIDEAQILGRKLLEELIPALMEGGQLVVAGVPNDLRDSILYYYVSRKDAMYLRYASHESYDWDEEKEKRAVELYGGRNTPQWRNLVEGLWGDYSYSVFKPSKLIESIVDIPSFVYKQHNGNSFEELYKQLELPIITGKYNFFIIGADMGYTSNSPLHVAILGVRRDSGKGDKEHYDIIYRLQVENMASYNLAKLMNYLMDYFQCKHCGFDTQSVGHQVYDTMLSKELFPSTYLRNKKFILPVIFTKPVIMGKLETFDQTTNKDVEEDVKYSMKVAGTFQMQKLLEEDRFHIAEQDSIAEDYDDIITILQAETQSPSMKSLHPFIYSNTINDHAVDALRCCALVSYLIVEKGYFRGGYSDTMVKPARLGNNFFHKQGRTIRRR